MVVPLLTDDEFLRAFTEVGPHELARRLNIHRRAVYLRRARLELKLKQAIRAPAEIEHNNAFRPVGHPQRICIDVKEGHVLVASDAHYWPGEPSIMHRALVRMCKDLEPRTVIMNGDVSDFASISRHPPIGWQHQPTVQEEIETAQERLHEIEQAVRRSTTLIWTLGNHDARFETRLATIAKEFAQLNGFQIKDYFPAWKPAWSCWLNDSVVIKHRFRGGDHAPFNNTIRSGRTIVTGHLHSAKVIPFTDYDGDRYGVDTGCLADTSHKAFVDYTEDNPLNWRSAFCVLTFKNGALLYPELALKVDDKHFQFRGEIIKV